MNSIEASLPPFSRPRLTYTHTLRWLSYHNSSALSDLVPFICSVFPLHTLDSDPTVKTGEIVFLVACFVTMVGCGLLSSFLQHKRSMNSTNKRRLRRSLRKDSRKGSGGTVTSSDEDGYESSGSWHHVSETTRPDQIASQHGDGPQDGKSRP